MANLLVLLAKIESKVLLESGEYYNFIIIKCFLIRYTILYLR